MSAIFLIFGPTASGKSDLALKMAQKIGAEIINMDSMQVYEGIGIISAAPTKSDMSELPHHLYLHVAPSHIYSTGEYINEARRKIDDIISRGKKVVFVGGTGLYAHALTNGLVEVPKIDEKIRNKSREFTQTDIIAAFNYLKQIDHKLANSIKPNDSQRIARAIEVFEATGKPLSEWQEMPQAPILPKGKWRAFKLLPEREIVHKNIAKRFVEMINNGGLEEVQALWRQKLSPELPSMKALGIPHLFEYFEGKMPLEEAIELAIIATRQYAKRQYTWANNRARDWEIITPSVDFSELVY